MKGHTEQNPKNTKEVFTMSNLFHFLTDLATNPQQQEAFAKKPDAVMAAVGLSQSDQAMLKSGKNAQIAVNLADELFPSAFCLVDPSPDPSPDPDPLPDSDTPDSDTSEDAAPALAYQQA